MLPMPPQHFGHGVDWVKLTGLDPLADLGDPRPRRRRDRRGVQRFEREHSGRTRVALVAPTALTGSAPAMRFGAVGLPQGASHSPQQRMPASGRRVERRWIEIDGHASHDPANRPLLPCPALMSP